MYRTFKDTIPSKSETDKSIILDIDQTLVYTRDDISELVDIGVFKNPEYYKIRDRIYVLKFKDTDSIKDRSVDEDNMWGLVRPNAHEFLTFCFRYFKNVIVWSAGEEDYVRKVVKFLCRDLPQPKIVYTKNDCVFVNRHPTIKPLSKMMENEPWLGLTEKNTLFLDDMDYTFSKNPENAIHIPGYIPFDECCEATVIGGAATGAAKMKEDELSLKELRNWLDSEEVRSADDVRLLDKSKIFTLKTLKTRTRKPRGPRKPREPKPKSESKDSKPKSEKKVIKESKDSEPEIKVEEIQVLV